VLDLAIGDALQIVAGDFVGERGRISTTYADLARSVRPGDLLLAVNGTPIQSVEQLRTLVGKSGKTVALLIQRDEGKIFIPVDIGDNQG